MDGNAELNRVYFQFVWSLGERLENLRSELLLGLKPSSVDRLMPVRVRASHTIRESRRERLENSAALTATAGQEAPAMVARLKR